jgi:hypothetical protein
MADDPFDDKTILVQNLIHDFAIMLYERMGITTGQLRLGMMGAARSVDEHIDSIEASIQKTFDMIDAHKKMFRRMDGHHEDGRTRDCGTM